MISGLAGSWQNAQRSVNRVDPISSGLRNFIDPPATTFRGIDEWGRDFATGLVSAHSLQVENRELRNQLNAVAMYTEQVERLNLEIDQLRRLQSIKGRPGQEPVTATIIGLFPYENRITLNVGSGNGIRAGMPVVCADGLVGIVQTVEPSRCQAMMLTSASVQIGAMAQAHNPPPVGLIRGINLNTLSLSFLDPKAPVQMGDTVITSGFGERIPRGLLIGKIIQVADDAQYGTRIAQVAPAVSIGSIQEVKVLR